MLLNAALQMIGVIFEAAGDHRPGTLKFKARHRAETIVVCTANSPGTEIFHLLGSFPLW